MRKPVIFFNVLLGILATLAAVLPQHDYVRGQSAYAATLRVTYPGVEVKRENTAGWLPLGIGAVMPFGGGDQVRTDETGRALLTLGSDAQVLLLPYSDFVMRRLEIDAGHIVRFSGELNGVAVHHLINADHLESYQLEAGALVITVPAVRFATWATTEPVNGITVAEGTMEILAAQQALTLAGGNGLLVDEAGIHSTRLHEPLNAARTAGSLFGCAGMINTVGDVPLRVRIGPGLGYVLSGDIPAQQPVQLMAVNAAGGWYRIQFLSSFGWVQALAVETECADLPVLPDGTMEILPQVYNVTSPEQQLLLPFFGVPADDPWFYRIGTDE